MRIPIVNENDEIIGEEERSIVHQKGILHREVHVWFVTPEKRIIFQMRGLNKETYPGLLDATAGGHVDTISETYEEAAEREAFEETGVVVQGNMIFIQKVNSKSYDEVTKLINNVFRSTYAYVFNGDVNKLKKEDTESMGFEFYSLEQIENLSEQERERFIPRIISQEYIDIYRKIIAQINENQNR